MRAISSAERDSPAALDSESELSELRVLCVCDCSSSPHKLGAAASAANMLADPPAEPSNECLLVTRGGS